MSMSKEMDDWQKREEAKHGIVTLNAPSGLSKKQAFIWDHMLSNGGRITLDEAVELVGKDIYCAKREHVGKILARMADRAMIVRIKRGVFEFYK